MGRRLELLKKKNVFFCLGELCIPGVLWLTVYTLCTLANSVYHYEMPHYAAFHLGIHCLPMYALRSH